MDFHRDCNNFNFLETLIGKKLTALSGGKTLFRNYLAFPKVV